MTAQKMLLQAQRVVDEQCPRRSTWTGSGVMVKTVLCREVKVVVDCLAQKSARSGSGRRTV